MMVEKSGTSGNGNGNGMRSTLEGIRDWLEQQQRHHEQLAQTVSQLTRDVAALASTVQQLAENQKGLLARHDRPIPWGAIIGMVTLLGVCAGLLIAPMQKNIDYLFDHQESNREKTEEHSVEDAYNMGRLEERTEWLEKLEERYWSNIHRGE